MSDKLTPEEKRVANLLADGNTVAEIAVLIGKSRSTVRVHLSKIYKKRNLKNATDLAIYVWRKRSNKPLTLSQSDHVSA